MTQKLPIDERIMAAARMAMRASVHYDLWWITASTAGRKQYSAIEVHWEHLRFLQHGQLVSCVGEVHALLDNDRRTISLPVLTDELRRKHGLHVVSAEEKLADIRPLFTKIRLLRNNVFAHRTARKSYDDMFTDAQLKPEQIQAMIQTCIDVANDLLIAIGGPQIDASPSPSESYGAMLAKLSERETSEK